MADVNLLFGVEGGGTLSGKSGNTIRMQLNSIVTELNKNPLQVKFAVLGSDSLTAGSGGLIFKGLKNIAQEINKTPIGIKFQVDPSSKSAIQRQLVQLMKDIGGVSFRTSSSGGSGPTRGSRPTQNTNDSASNRIRLDTRVTNMTTSMLKYRYNKTVVDSNEYKRISNYIKEARHLSELTKDAGTSVDELREKIDRLANKYANLREELAKTRSETRLLTQDSDGQRKALSEIDRLQNRAANLLSNNTAARGGVSSDAYASVENAARQMDDFRARLESGSVTASEAASAMREYKTALDLADSAMRQAGEDSRLLIDGNDDYTIALNRLRGLQQDNSKAVQDYANKSNSANQATRNAYSDLVKNGEAIDNLIQRLRLGELSESEFARSIELVTSAFKSNKKVLDGDSALPASGTKEYAETLSKIDSLLKQAAISQSNFTAAKNGKSAVAYNSYSQYIQQLNELREAFVNGTISKEEFDKRIGTISSGLTNTTRQIEEAGEATRGWHERLKQLYQSFGYYISMTRLVMYAIRSIKDMTKTAIDINDAMTTLKIVTRDTSAEYEKFGRTVSSTAQSIGASITDLLDSTTTYARLGYSLEESSALAKYTAMLQNVGGIDVTASQNAITAIVKAYKDIDIDDVESVMDRLVVTGNHFPISVSQLAEGMNNASSTLSAAGNNFNESVALLTAANTTIQNASKSSTGLRTIAARIRNTKADLDELGEEMTDAKYDELVQALTDHNVALKDAEGEYRSTYSIIKDIAAQWADMSSMEKAALATALSGTRQQAVFYSLVEQFQEASNAMDAMADSSGELEAAYGTYMESVTAHINQFKASYQDIASGFFDASFLNSIVDRGSTIIQILGVLLNIIKPLFSFLVELPILLPTITAAMLMVKGTVDSLNATRIVSMMISNKETGATELLQKSILGLTKTQQKALGVELTRAVASGTISKEQANQILQTVGLTLSENGLVAANTGLAASNHGLAASFKSLMASIPVWGWVALGVSVVIEVVTALSSVLKSTNDRIKDLESESKQLRSEISSIANEYSNLKKSADEVIPRFAELAKGVNQFGENVSLTDGEYAEFLELNNKIAEMFPELNLGMDSNGNAMLALSYSADTLRGSLEGLLDAQRALANEEIASKLPDAVKKANDLAGQYEGAKANLEGRIRTVQSGKKYIGAFSTDYQRQDALNAANNYIEYLKSFGVEASINETLSASQGPGGSQQTNVYVEFDPDQVGVSNIIAGYKKEIEDYARKIQAAWASINPSLSAWLQTNYLFDDMDEATQLLTRQLVGALDFSELGLETNTDIEKYIQTNIITPLFDADSAIKKAFDKFKNGLIDEADFRETLLGAINGKVEKMDDDVKAIFESLFISAAQKINPDISDFNSAISVIVDGLVVGSKQAASGVNNVTSSIEKLSDTIDKLKSNYDLLSKAQKEMAEGGGLSPETIKAFVDAMGESETYTDYLYEENGVIKLNVQAWKERTDAITQSQIKGLEDEITALEKQRAELESNNEEQSTSDYDEELTMLSAQIDEANRKLLLFKATLNNIGRNNNISEAFGDYYDALSGFETVATKIDAVSDSLSTLADIQDRISQGFTLSIDEALKFAKTYPQILDDATVAADGQITLNEDVVNAFIEGKRAELNANIDTKIAELESERESLEAKVIFYETELQIVQDTLNGELNGNEDAAKQIVNGLNELVQKYIEAGYDESEAYRLALDAMSTNSGKFKSFVSGVWSDVDTAVGDASSNMADNIKNNMQSAAQNIDNVRKTANETAKAVRGIDSGTVEGTSLSVEWKGSWKNNSLQYDKSFPKMLLNNQQDATFDGKLYDYTAQIDDLQDFVKGINIDIENYKKSIDSINGQIATLEALRNAPLNLFKSDNKSGKNGGDNNTSKVVEEYKADIEALREELEELAKAQQSVANAQYALDNETELTSYINAYNALREAYATESEKQNAVFEKRSQLLNDNIWALQQYGFEIEYNTETGRVFVKNLEHINSLTKTEKGEYESVEEATNAYRKDVEELIEATEQLSDDQQQTVEDIRGITDRLKEGRQAAIDFYDSIADGANEVVDGFKNVYTTLIDAAKEYNENGFLSVDSFQSILQLGPKYMAFLYDEHDQLIINKDALQQVIAAKTEEMAIETALAHVAKLNTYAQEKQWRQFWDLAAATDKGTESTWDFIFSQAELAKTTAIANGMLEEEADAVYKNQIDYLSKLRKMSKMAASNIGASMSALEEGYISQREGLESIIDLTKDLIKWENEQQVDALEKEKDDYADIIEQKKKVIELAKEQADREKTVEEKLRKMAKLQAQIAQLSLDDSREAQAQRRGLEEELADLQREIADDNADYAYDVQVDALDDQLEAFNKSKDKEIEEVQQTINSEEKLYNAALERLDSKWESTYDDLINWNTEYGSSLNSEIVSAWDAATEAVNRYGSATDAVRGTKSSDTIGTDTTQYVDKMKQNSRKWFLTADANEQRKIEEEQQRLVDLYNKYTTGSQVKRDNGQIVYTDGSGVLFSLDKEAIANDIVSMMYQNSKFWYIAESEQRQNELAETNAKLASQLAALLGKTITQNGAGVWMINGEELYKKYHSGGIVGDAVSPKQNEVLALLEKGEAVLDKDKELGLYKVVDFVSVLSDKLGTALDPTRIYGVFGSIASSIPSIANLAARNGNAAAVLQKENAVYHVDNVEVVAPVQVVQKLDDEEIRRHSEMIGALSAEYIKQGFTKGGIRKATALI